MENLNLCQPRFRELVTERSNYPLSSEPINSTSNRARTYPILGLFVKFTPGPCLSFENEPTQLCGYIKRCDARGWLRCTVNIKFIFS